MRGKSEGLYLYTRHSRDCKYHPAQFDRNTSRRCNCVRYIGGTAADGTQLPAINRNIELGTVAQDPGPYHGETRSPEPLAAGCVDRR